MRSWDDIMAEHERKLADSFRVRVRLGECPHMIRWHGTIEDGAVGKIIGYPGSVINVGAPDDHVYYVWFDRPIRGRVGWSYAAAELVPIITDEFIGDLAAAATGAEGE